MADDAADMVEAFAARQGAVRVMSRPKGVKSEAASTRSAWEPLAWRAQAAHAYRGVHRQRPDPYLIWAIATNWRFFQPSRVSLRRPAATVETAPVTLLVELEGGRQQRQAFDLALKELPGHETAFPAISSVYEDQSIFTLHLSRELLPQLGDPSTALGRDVRRYDLCQPVVPERSASEPLVAARDEPQLQTDREVLLGLIDDGCAFAHPNFSYEAGGTRQTRVLAIWDQGGTAFTGAASPRSRLGYGCEVRREAAPKAARASLNQRLARATNGAGVVDEEGCYRDAGYLTMRKRVAHGPHVMDVFAGPVPIANRMLSAAGASPTFAVVHDVAADPAKSDIVFVQLPRADIQDASGGWLGASVLDGVQCILAHANAQTRVVICISYGSTVGPRDGSSLIEKALDRVVEGRKAAGRLDLVIAAGNSFETRGHARLALGPGALGHLRWRVLPGSEAPSFLQLWWPLGSGAGSEVRITPPGGTPDPRGWLSPGATSCWPQAAQPQALAVFEANPSRGEGRPMLLLALAPTECIDSADHPVAAHGDWTIEVKSRTPVEVDACIARNDSDIGALRRGRQSYFVDTLDDPERYLRPARDDVDAEDVDDKPIEQQREHATIRRRGTLNGIANGGEVKLAAGYCLRDMTRARYSSAGALIPAGYKSGPSLKQADFAFPTDESAALPGIRAAGTRGASVFRLVGTSTAAPQYARRLASNQVPRQIPGEAGKDPTPLLPDVASDGHPGVPLQKARVSAVSVHQRAGKLRRRR